jgi:outer membrane PBP1 activator LpoA protein
MRSRRSVLSAILMGGLAGPLSALAQTRANNGAPVVRARFGSGPTTIAVLVPPKGGLFDRATDCLLAGIRAAHAVDGTDVSVQVIETQDEPIALGETLARLKEQGVAMAIGPITRNGANGLLTLGEPPVPTLALNLPEGDIPPGSQAVYLNLATESEARQVAALAFAQALPKAASRRPRAVTLVADARVALRSAVAFSDEWVSLGGELIDPIEFEGQRPPRDLRARFGATAPDVAFAAMTAEQARTLRRDLGKDMALWSTSMASIGANPISRLAELDGMRLLEMPWNVQPEHPVVKAHRKAPSSYTIELQRLYAVGIDGYRSARQLLIEPKAFELDGVTGRLRFDRSQAARIDRTSVPVVYRGGRVIADRSIA